jgi:parallel beta-helix repeat protein
MGFNYFALILVISIFAGLGFANCVNLSDPTTYYGGNVVAVSGTYYLNGDVTLCTGTYSTTTPDLIDINASSVTFDCNGSTLMGAGTGVGVENSMGYDYTTVENCNLMDFGSSIDFENGASYGKIINNNASSDFVGIYLDDSSMSTIANNDVSSNHYGIDFEDGSADISVSNNKASSDFDGIFVDDSFNSSITNNDVSSNNYGIDIEDHSAGINVSNNNAGSDYGGIYFDDSFNSNVFNNTIGSDGIDIEDGSTGINASNSNGSSSIFSSIIQYIENLV